MATRRAVLWVVVALAVAIAGVLAGGAPASAHALAVSSNPPAGATLADAPKTVTIVFSEAPDPRLSTIQVLDSSGAPHQIGRSRPVPGQANTLQVDVGPLSPGVYTVSWRTVSSVDGHFASGSFAFGVKVTPVGAAASSGVVRSPPASTWAVAARWSFYVGLMLLVGTAEIGLLFSPLRRLRAFAAGGWLLAAGGVIALEEQQRRSDGIPFGSLWGSSLGHQVLGRAVPIAVAAAVIGWVWARTSSRAALAALGVSGLLAMLGDVDASHVAGEHSWRWFHLLTQWAHFAAAGVWLGGLAVVLGVIGSFEPARRRILVRRFSNVALASVALIAVTGALRGLDEIRSWHGLFDTTFGRWAIAKIVLLAAVIALGSLQRWRGVRSVETGGGRLLLRVGATEMAVAAVVLVAAGFLQSLAPPTATSTPGQPKPLVVAGHDFATTVKVQLDISPGTPGFDRFVLQALDYDTQHPIPSGDVSLTFAIPARPDLGSSTLTMARQRDGEYVAVAPNLSVAGTWSITVLIQQGSRSAVVPLTVTTRTAPVRVDVSRGPGLPTIYTIHVTSTASLQVYLDPGKPGFNEFHVTVLAVNGNELTTSQVTVHAGRLPGQVASSLTVRRLDNVGHFVADLPRAISASYQFSIDATTTQGPLHADITIPIP
jgi:methionine-rich copper-binding protein CopC/putative copper export protein